MKLLLGVAVITFGFGVWMGLSNPDENGSPSIGWIQSGVATSLLTVTAAYALSANRSLEEIRRARFDSLRPILALRFTPTAGNKLRTYICNIGTGVAFGGTLWISGSGGIVSLGKNHKDSYRTKLGVINQNDKLFSMPLGVHAGDEEAQIEIGTGPTTLLHNVKYECIIEYQDTYNRHYITHLCDMKQSVYGPLTEKEKEKYIDEHKQESLTEEEFQELRKRMPAKQKQKLSRNGL